MKASILNNPAVKRASAAVIGVLLAVTLLAPASSARAQTSAQLQAQINQLLAVIAQLQAQLGTGGTASTCPALTQPLTIGSRGPNVTALQTYLIGQGHSIPAGATGYFGTQTRAAVAAWQAANGVAPAAGYWGPISLTKYNTICTVTGGDDDDDDDDRDEDDELRGGEASLEGFEVNDEETNLSEGDDEVEVMSVEFDVEDGDVEVNRIDVAFDHVSGGDDDPWDVFDSIGIMVDGDMVAEMDISDEDEWEEDDPNNGDYTIRLTDIDDFVVREGETAEFAVVLTVAGSVDDADTGVEWELFIPDDGIRATDGLNINHYTGDTDDTVSFDIDEEGADNELMVRSSDEDPDATTLQLDDTDNSDWLTVFAFELDTEDSDDDIEIQTIPVEVEFSTSTYNALVNDARLVIDGEEYDDFTVTNGNTDTATLSFDIDGDLVIDAGDTVTVELELEFNELDEDLEGTTLQSSVEGDDIEAEGADDLDDDQTGGSATSETHTLRTSGVTLDMTESTTDVRDNDTAADTGIYTIQFDVTAFEEDVYIARSAASGTALGTAGVNYLVEDSDGDQVGDGTSTAALSSNATVSGNRFVVREGQTREFTLTVSYTPASDGFYRVQLYSVNQNDENAAPDVQQRALPEQDFETDYESLDA